MPQTNHRTPLVQWIIKHQNHLRVPSDYENSPVSGGSGVDSIQACDLSPPKCPNAKGHLGP